MKKTIKQPALISLLCSMLALAVGQARDLTVEQAFLWQQADALASTAANVAEWKQAALLYQQLADAGAAGGRLDYNLGTAWLKAEEYTLAVDALTRAESYLGAHPDLKRNLKIALARRDGKENVEWPWYRFVFIWHFHFSATGRLQAAIVSFLIFWLGFILIRLGRRGLGKTLSLPAFFLCALLATSYLATLHRQYQVPRLKFTDHPSVEEPAGD